MRPEDGRVVTNFIVQALLGKPLTIYGDGSQTRSFGYVGDIAAGTIALLDSGHAGPMNLGNPDEFTMIDPGWRQPALTVASASPPCAPTPGIRSGRVGANARTRSISAG